MLCVHNEEYCINKLCCVYVMKILYVCCLIYLQKQNFEKYECVCLCCVESYIATKVHTD